MIYIMNYAVMPSGNFGYYEYQPSDVKMLRQIVRDVWEPFESRIECSQTIELIRQWTGIEIELNRTEVKLNSGDYMFVMCLNKMIADPVTTDAPVSENLEDWDFALIYFTENKEQL